jgi:transposase
MFAPIGEQVCDGSYIAFVMKKVNGPAQARVTRALPKPARIRVFPQPASGRAGGMLRARRTAVGTVVSKYCNHTPLHRQSVILERDTGLEISRAMLDGWVVKVG